MYTDTAIRVCGIFSGRHPYIALNQVFAGAYLSSHNGIESCWGLAPGIARKIEWVEETIDRSGLSVSVILDEDAAEFEAAVLAKYPNRDALLKSIAVGKGYWGYETILCEARYRNGMLEDAEDGTAAFRAWEKNGQLVVEEHYKNNYLQDTLDGVAAVRGWDQGGKLIRVRHVKDG